MEYQGATVEEVILQGTPDFQLAVPDNSVLLGPVRGIRCINKGILWVQNSKSEVLQIGMNNGDFFAISPSKIMENTTGEYILLL